MEGWVDSKVVRELGDWFYSEGVSGITICDTTGMANPWQVSTLCEGLVERWPNLELTLHFHNTRGMGLANVIAGLMSDAQEELHYGDTESARKTLNRAKALLFETINGKYQLTTSPAGWAVVET